MALQVRKLLQQTPCLVVAAVRHGGRDPPPYAEYSLFDFFEACLSLGRPVRKLLGSREAGNEQAKDQQ